MSQSGVKIIGNRPSPARTHRRLRNVLVQDEKPNSHEKLNHQKMYSTVRQAWEDVDM